ncbi:MAG TPA: universal stress protein [Methylomirabilota bacterium]|jgi:nucleotide-binding universal stress UspA family protein|nr:universal stress protein [Methylomirabilota bacterium]
MVEPVRTILCPADLSENSLMALEYAAYFARQHHAKLYVLYVLPTEEVSLPSELYRRDEKSGGADLGWAEKVAREKVQEMAHHCLNEGICYHILVRSGDPATGILAAAESIAAGMIVMVTHGRTGLAHVFMGSVAERVVRESLCPVLLIRGRGREGRR